LPPSSELSEWGFEVEDGGSKVFRNVGILSQHCTASQLRRPRFEYSETWKSQILHIMRKFVTYPISYEQNWNWL